METYPQRVTRFFLQSIHTLKKESGGQRWNEICEHAAFFAFMKLPYGFSQDSFWQLFFEPPATIGESSILVYFSNSEDITDILFTLLHVLTDPPEYKWNELYAQCT